MEGKGQDIPGLATGDLRPTRKTTLISAMKIVPSLALLPVSLAMPARGMQFNYWDGARFEDLSSHRLLVRQSIA